MEKEGTIVPKTYLTTVKPWLVDKYETYLMYCLNRCTDNEWVPAQMISYGTLVLVFRGLVGDVVEKSETTRHLGKDEALISTYITHRAIILNQNASEP